ncbi:MAG: TFIIB-type zinc ribbon-containing protein [Desulfurococcaceae archaeon]|uniref:TFIIB-type zinc ribbon-containing protein n=1 Tax=Staphylothermus marinus TaxID=2280 RepID=A0A7C4HC44_STAMA
MNDKCPDCGNSLIWVYEKGEIVCSTCGLVVDKIIYDGPVRESEDEEIKRIIKTRRNPRVDRLYFRYKYHNRLYRLAESYVRNKPWLEVDYDKVLETGRLVNTIKHRATIDAEKKITKLNLWNYIESGLKHIREINPAVLSRSGRGRYALSYIVAYYLDKKEYPSMKNVVELFNISETSYRRLLKIAREILTVKNTVVTK